MQLLAFSSQLAVSLGGSSVLLTMSSPIDDRLSARLSHAVESLFWSVVHVRPVNDEKDHNAFHPLTVCYSRPFPKFG